MMPSIELRLQTMTKALQEVILPAIAEGNDLAREQAQLLLAHLGLLGQHWRHAQRYDQMTLDAIKALATQLLTAAAGGAATMQAAADLRVCLQHLNEKNADAAHQRAMLAAAIDSLVSASGKDGERTFRDCLFDAIVEHGAQQTARDRVWFAASGMDPESAAFASIDEMLAGSKSPVP
jgi:hypothetical protein